MKYQINYEGKCIGTFISNENPQWLLENFEPVADEIYGTIEKYLDDLAKACKHSKISIKKEARKDLYLLVIDYKTGNKKGFHIVDVNVNKENRFTLEFETEDDNLIIALPYENKLEYFIIKARYVIWVSPNKSDIDRMKELIDER